MEEGKRERINKNNSTNNNRMVDYKCGKVVDDKKIFDESVVR